MMKRYLLLMIVAIMLIGAGCQKVDIAGKAYSPGGGGGGGGGDGGGGPCFLPGTRITLSDGSAKNIEDIVVDDKVLAYDEVAGKLKPALVTHTFSRSSRGYLVINDFLKVTAEHPLLVNGKWIKAEEVKVGDVLLKYSDGVVTSVIVHTIDVMHEEVTAYNLHVDGYNTYLAEGIVVHNKGDPPPPDCFLEGTPVTLADGSRKNIEELRVGDYVMAYDENKREAVPTEVLKTFSQESQRYLIINDVLRVTPQHPMMVNGRWTLAGDVQRGDRLLQYEEGKFKDVTVIKIESRSEPTTVYNLEVDKQHTYFAQDFVVHNKAGTCFLAGTPITLADGSLRNIEKLAAGDVVLAYDEKSGRALPASVLQTFVRETGEYLVINGVLKVTHEHPMLVNDKWKTAGQINVGDTLLQYNNGQFKSIIVRTIEDVVEPVTVYNLEVDTYHTYLAENFVVHNKYPPEYGLCQDSDEANLANTYMSTLTGFNPWEKGTVTTITADEETDFCTSRASASTSTQLVPQSSGDALVEYVCGSSHEDNRFIVLSCNCNDGRCVKSSCGNGIKQASEQCDDGNVANGDGCSEFCNSESCGDGVKDTSKGEQCDDGGLCTDVSGDPFKQIFANTFETGFEQWLSTGAERDSTFATDQTWSVRLGKPTAIPGKITKAVGPLSGRVKLSAYVARKDNTGPLMITLKSGATEAVKVGMIAGQSGQTVGPWQWNDGSATLTGGNYDAFLWYRVVVIADIAQDKFDFYVYRDSFTYNLLADHASFSAPVASIDSIEFTGNELAFADYIVLSEAKYCDASHACTAPDTCVSYAGDGCDSACYTETCGNGIWQAGEQCDDGDMDNTDGCNALCQYVNSCGNGVLNQIAGSPYYETCDDGCISANNPVGCDALPLNDGDGCSVTCQRVLCTDADYDGYGVGTDLSGCRKSQTAIDCNDANPAINPDPATVEVCGDGVDNDCKGGIDNGCTCVDGDGDKYGRIGTYLGMCGGSTTSEDCDDTNIAIYQYLNVYVDNDHDGYGTGASTTTVCSGLTPPVGYSMNNNDCDDNTAAINPGAAEICNDGIDNDCVGGIDNNCPVCGNGRLESASGETCDDGCRGQSPPFCDSTPLDNWDGCSATCQIESCLDSVTYPFLSNLIAWWDGTDATVIGPQFVKRANVQTNAAGKFTPGFNFPSTGGALTSDIGAAGLPFGSLSGGFTFAAWVNILGSASPQRILTYGGRTPTSGCPATPLRIYSENPGSGNRIVLGIGSLGINIGPITNGWHFVAFTYTASMPTLYVDSVSKAFADSVTINVPSQCVNAVGADYQNSVIMEPFEGLIDEVQYYNRALDATQISQLRNSPAGVCHTKK